MRTCPPKHRPGCERLATDCDAKALAISEMLFRVGYRLLESPGGISYIRVKR